MERLIEVLEQVKAGIDYRQEKQLVENGLLDSFDLVELIAAIDEEFDVQIPVMEIQPESFNDVESIYALIQRLEEE